MAEDGRERAERGNVAGDIDTGCKNEKEKDTTRVWNDYLSFKTNSRVSAKSFANQRGRRAEVPEGCRRELRREGKGGYGGEIIC